jgi:ABC-type transport system substrate-binding protein
MGILRKYYDYDENTGMLTNFKPMTFLYSNGEDKESIGVHLQGALEEIGITLNLENQENNTFLSNRG